MNPVKAGLVKQPEEYTWSSAAAHIQRRDDALVKVAPLLSMVDDWESFLALTVSEEDAKIFKKHESTGRPLGDKSFLSRLEIVLNRELIPRKSGPKPKAKRS